jgi:hypothetical protein
VSADHAKLGRVSAFAVDYQIQGADTRDTTLTSAKSSFGMKFSSLIWVSTTGAQLVLVWWYRKQPIFWLPAGWAPGPVAWILSFPSAPKGEYSLSGASYGF